MSDEINDCEVKCTRCGKRSSVAHPCGCPDVLKPAKEIDLMKALIESLKERGGACMLALSDAGGGL